MQIEFTDRYGGNPPSWLRGCFTCEAMGCYPEPPNSAYGPDSVMNINADIDEWKFVPCPDCNGTGRVSWLVSILRIPRWIWKGICFVREAGLNWEMKAPWMNKWQHLILCFKCAFLVDLGLWKP